MPLVTVTAGATAVVGDGTRWLADVKAGDIFYDRSGTNQLFRVQSVEDDLHLTIWPAYTGSSGLLTSWDILPLYTALSMGDLAWKLAELVSRWQTWMRDWATWLGGSATGGPYSDGRYPLTDVTGAVTLVECPAKFSAIMGDANGIAQQIIGSVGAAQAAATQVSNDLQAWNGQLAEAQQVAATVAGQAGQVATDRALVDQAKTMVIEAATTIAGQAGQVATDRTLVDQAKTVVTTAIETAVATAIQTAELRDQTQALHDQTQAVAVGASFAVIADGAGTQIVAGAAGDVLIIKGGTHVAVESDVEARTILVDLVRTNDLDPWSAAAITYLDEPVGLLTEDGSANLAAENGLSLVVEDVLPSVGPTVQLAITDLREIIGRSARRRGIETLATEAGDVLVTEAGDVLVTEAGEPATLWLAIDALTARLDNLTHP